MAKKKKKHHKRKAGAPQKAFRQQAAPRQGNSWPENDIEDWQLAGITAMLDKCNETGTVPYDIPTAIKGLLCMHILCEGK